MSTQIPVHCISPLSHSEGVEEQETGQEDGQELACGHDGGKDQGTKGLDGVADEQGACRWWVIVCLL